MKESQARLRAVVADLNDQTPEHPNWVPLEGFVALTSVKLEIKDGDRSASFNPGAGVPIKAFMNTETGEIRTFTYEAVI